MRISIIIAGLLLLYGCNTERKAQRSILKIGVRHPQVLANICSKQYPPLVFLKDSIVYKAAKTEPQYVYVDCDSVRRDSNSVAKVKILCPVSKVSDTVFVFKERHLLNKAHEELLEIELHDMVVKNAILTKRNRVLIWICSLLAIIIIARLLARVYNILL